MTRLAEFGVKLIRSNTCRCKSCIMGVVGCSQEVIATLPAQLCAGLTAHFRALRLHGEIINATVRLNITPAWIKTPSIVNINKSYISARGEMSAFGSESVLRDHSSNHLAQTSKFSSMPSSLILSSKTMREFWYQNVDLITRLVCFGHDILDPVTTEFGCIPVQTVPWTGMRLYQRCCLFKFPHSDSCLFL